MCDCSCGMYDPDCANSMLQYSAPNSRHVRIRHDLSIDTHVGGVVEMQIFYESVKNVFHMLQGNVLEFLHPWGMLREGIVHITTLEPDDNGYVYISLKSMRDSYFLPQTGVGSYMYYPPFMKTQAVTFEMNVTQVVLIKMYSDPGKFTIHIRRMQEACYKYNQPC